MHQRALLILAVIAAIAVIAAVWLTQQRRATTVVEAGGPLVAGLSDAVNSVTRVRLEDGRGSVTLERGESGWHIAERGGYPADLTQLRRKLLALGEAQLIEKKTANPENYALLGVGDPEPVATDGEADADSDERSTRVTLEGLTEPVSVILGKSNFRGNPTTYVRRAGEQQSWLAAGDLTMEADPKEWLKRDLIDIGTPRIKRVVLTHPDGTEIEIEKPARDAPDYALKAVPEGRELLSRLDLSLAASEPDPVQLKFLAEDCRRQFEAALRESPEHPEALLGIGRSHRSAGRDRAATPP